VKWLTELRERGAVRFAEVGFPTTRQEAWRFTDVRPIAETSFGKGVSRWIVAAPDAQGISIGSLSQTGDVAQAHLGRYADLSANPFTALATAFLDDVQVVSIPARTEVTTPIRLSHRLEGAGGGAVMGTPRVLIVLGDQARATVIETHEDGGAAPSFSNSVTEIVLGNDPVPSGAGQRPAVHVDRLGCWIVAARPGGGARGNRRVARVERAVGAE
jgi:Fe-S cluster assembly protein SufD